MQTLNLHTLCAVLGVFSLAVGESGSGKSVLAKLIMKLEPPTNGKIFIDCNQNKKNITSISSKDYSHKVQMIFQDPYTSLNPRKKIWQIISAPFAATNSCHQDELFTIAEKYSQMVGLGHEYLQAYPSALSGGQRQRVGIARALVLQPELLILDESLQSLDVSTQAQIINLLIDVQADMGLAYLFISHDMNMVERFADQIAVMQAGEIIALDNLA